jgi:hypothetical protein
MRVKQLCPYMTVDRDDGQVCFSCRLSIKMCVDGDRPEDCSLYRKAMTDKKDATSALPQS